MSGGVGKKWRTVAASLTLPRFHRRRERIRLVSPEATAPVAFDNATGKIAVLLREKNPKSKKIVNVICLYDKKSGKASIAEYQWLGQ